MCAKIIHPGHSYSRKTLEWQEKMQIAEPERVPAGRKRKVVRCCDLSSERTNAAPLLAQRKVVGPQESVPGVGRRTNLGCINCIFHVLFPRHHVWIGLSPRCFRTFM